MPDYPLRFTPRALTPDYAPLYYGMSGRLGDPGWLFGRDASARENWWQNARALRYRPRIQQDQEEAMNNSDEIAIEQSIAGIINIKNSTIVNAPERAVKKFEFEPWVIYSPIDGIAATTIRSATVTVVDREVIGSGVSTLALWYFEQQNHYFEFTRVRFDFNLLDDSNITITTVGGPGLPLCTNWGNKSGEKAIKPAYFELIASASLRFEAYGRRC
jgi:hypothetical protein